MRNLVLLLFFALALSTLSFLPAFSFDLWRDDWLQIWSALYNPQAPYGGLVAAKLYHPISAYEQIILAPWFKFDPFKWQLLGFLLKILFSVSAGLLSYSVTKSRKAAFYSWLLAAIFIGGLESFTWISAHASAYIAFIFVASIFIWTKFVQKSDWRYFLFSVLILVVGILADLSRFWAGLILIGLWDAILLRRDFIKRQLLMSLVKWLIVLIFFGYYLMVIKSAAGNPFSGFIDHVYGNPILVVNNLFSSIGSLLLGWFINIPQEVAISNLGNVRLYERFLQLARIISALILLSSIIPLSFFAYVRSNKKAQVVLFFVVGIFVFFLPNWMTQTYLYEGGGVVGITHRYLTLSALCFVCLLSYFLTMMRVKLRLMLITTFLITNITIGQIILHQESEYRFASLYDSFYTKMISDVNRDGKPMIFIFLGDNRIKTYLLNWSGSVPYAAKLGISNFEDMPIVPTSDEMVIKLTCLKNGGEFTDSYGIKRLNNITLDHLYSFTVIGGNLIDSSTQSRMFYQTELEKRGCI